MRTHRAATRRGDKKVWLSLPERFLILRRRAGMSQEELARVLGVCTRTVARVENEEGGVRREMLDKFEMLEARHAGR